MEQRAASFINRFSVGEGVRITGKGLWRDVRLIVGGSLLVRNLSDIVFDIIDFKGECIGGSSLLFSTVVSNVRNWDLEEGK